MTKFCAVDYCDNEASNYALRDDKGLSPLPLCGNCSTAYGWGQASPDRPLVDIEDYDREIEEELLGNKTPRQIWLELSRIPLTVYGNLKKDFYIWGKGADVEEIIEWFEDKLSVTQEELENETGIAIPGRDEGSDPGNRNDNPGQKGLDLA